MKNMNGVNGGDQILRLKIVEGKAEVTAGNKLSDVTNDKIREYFQNNVDTGAKDGVISEAEIKAHRDSQAQQSSDPTQWKTTFGTDENGKKIYRGIPNMDLAYMWAYNEVSKKDTPVGTDVSLKFKPLVTVLEITGSLSYQRLHTFGLTIS